MDEKQMQQYREFLKDSIRQKIDFSETDQNRGIAPPPMEKPAGKDQKRIDLLKKKEWQSIKAPDLISVIAKRRSRRNFTSGALTLEEISFLLWATQGVQRKFRDVATYRTVPSAGARHALETYLCILNVEGLEVGIYRYLPLSHQLVQEKTFEDISGIMVKATLGQAFIADAAVTFIWTAVPYRMEWRYGPAAHKVIAIDSGHVCQNLYLACEAISAGTCAIAAYDQKAMDKLVGADGEEEFVIYLAPVGKT